MKWITNDMVKLLSGIQGISSVEVHPQGGDVDTSNLILNIKNGQGEQLFICGFNIDDYITTPDDVEIEMIEVSDGLDGRGGLSSDIDEVCVAYGRVTGALRRAGFQVVECLKDYF